MNHFQKPSEQRGPRQTTVHWIHYCLLFPRKPKHLLEPPLRGCLWISPPASVVVSQLTEMKTTAIIQLSNCLDCQDLSSSEMLTGETDTASLVGISLWQAPSNTRAPPSRGVGWQGGWWGRERGWFWAGAWWVACFPQPSGIVSKGAFSILKSSNMVCPKPPKHRQMCSSEMRQYLGASEERSLLFQGLLKTGDK